MAWKSQNGPNKRSRPGEKIPSGKNRKEAKEWEKKGIFRGQWLNILVWSTTHDLHLSSGRWEGKKTSKRMYVSPTNNAFSPHCFSVETCSMKPQRKTRLQRRIYIALDSMSAMCVILEVLSLILKIIEKYNVILYAKANSEAYTFSLNMAIFL